MYNYEAVYVFVKSSRQNCKYNIWWKWLESRVITWDTFQTGILKFVTFSLGSCQVIYY